jgi:hypothetical protein
MGGIDPPAVAPLASDKKHTGLLLRAAAKAAMSLARHRYLLFFAHFAAVATQRAVAMRAKLDADHQTLSALRHCYLLK